MAIRVIPEKAPQQDTGFSRPEIAFELRPGKQGHSGNLPTWRFLAGRHQTADALTEMFEGATQNDKDGSSKLPFEIMTQATELEVVVSGNDAIYDHLVQWGTPGQPPVHDCDGMYSNLEVNRGEECGCGGDWERIKDRGKKNIGPKPSIEVTFRLAHDYELGVGKAIFGGWVLPEDLHKIRNELDKVSGEVLLTLAKVDKKSKAHEWTANEIIVQGSYNDAISEER